jgi:hypothetical protein
VADDLGVRRRFLGDRQEVAGQAHGMRSSNRYGAEWACSTERLAATQLACVARGSGGTVAGSTQTRFESRNCTH